MTLLKASKDALALLERIHAAERDRTGEHDMLPWPEMVELENVISLKELYEQAVPSLCHRCAANLNDPFKLQTYEVSDSKRGIRLFINVTAAYAFAKRNLQPMEIPQEYVEKMVLVNMSETFCGAHVEHVDRSFPAIIGMYEEEKDKVAMLLLDGTHRLFGAVKHHEKALAYVLEHGDLIRFVLESETLL